MSTILLVWKGLKAQSPFTEYTIKPEVSGKYTVDYYNYNDVTPQGNRKIEATKPSTGHASYEAAVAWAQAHFEEKMRAWQKPSTDRERIISAIQYLVDTCHGQAVAGGWWHDIETGEPKERNKGELLMLITSEVAEAMEGARKGLNDDHLPQYTMEEVEIGDVLIRAFDYIGGYGLETASAFADKLEYNAKRADHKPENRQKAGGKKF